MGSQTAMIVSCGSRYYFFVALCGFAVAIASQTATGQGIQIEIGERSNQYTKHQEVRRAIRRSMTIHADDTTLAEFTKTLSEKLGVPIDLDLAQLEAEGLDGSTSLRVHLQDQPFSSALRPLALTYLIAHGRVLITTEEGCRDYDNVEVYDVSRLVDARTRMAAATVGDFDPWSVPLVRAITENIAVNSWSVVGGTGEIQVLFLDEQTLLIVNQLDQTLEEVESFLDFLQKQLDERPVGKGTNRKELSPVGEPLGKEAEKLTRLYSLSLPEDVCLDEVVDLIPSLVPQGDWETDKEAVCRRLGNRLVMRHRLDILLQVEVELANAGLLRPRSPQHGQGLRDDNGRPGNVPPGGMF